MKTALLVAAALATVLSTNSASAQNADRQRLSDRYSDGQSRDGRYNEDGDSRDTAGRIDELRTRVQRGAQGGAIDRQTAARLRQQIREVSQLDGQYSRNGYTEQESAELRDELADARRAVRAAEGGRNDNRQSDTDRPRSGLGGLLEGALGKKPN